MVSYMVPVHVHGVIHCVRCSCTPDCVHVTSIFVIVTVMYIVPLFIKLHTNMRILDG